MSRFVKVATLEELVASGSLELEREGHILALFRDEDEVIAMDGMCPHQGGPLASGEIRGNVLSCPWHGWQFDLKSGQCLTARSVRQARYPVRIEGTDILVQLP